ncbi:MAG: site-specific integrase [Hyphomicrobiales bacterium]|nr:site-specific integrase [Hyphomicrobiales bacterium]
MATIEKRQSDSGSSYRVKVRLKGHPIETATFERLTDAKKWAQATEAAIREGRYFKTSEARRHTLADMIDRYMRDVLPTKPKSEAKQKNQLIWWKDAIGAYTLADVTPAMISEQRDRLLNGITYRGTKRSPSTVVRYMAALSHAFTIAVREWGWLEDSPMRKVRKPKEPRGRVRFLSDTEREKLLTACAVSENPFLYPVVILALSTGMRYGEIMHLTWDDVNTEQGYVILHETKNGERRRVPLAGRALQEVRALAKVRRIDTVLLFPDARKNQPASLRRAWDKAVAAAEIDDFRFHDLRHSAASYLAMNGASLAEIAEVLGHKTLQMVKRYSHLSEAHTASVVAKMNERIFGG